MSLETPGQVRRRIVLDAAFEWLERPYPTVEEVCEWIPPPLDPELQRVMEEWPTQEPWRRYVPSTPAMDSDEGIPIYSVGTDGEATQIITARSECEGAWIPPKMTMRVYAASSGDPNEVDIVILRDGVECERFENKPLECFHLNSKVYSGVYFASDPPQWHWVCEMCGETGADLLLHPPPSDLAKFWRLYKLFGHGE